MPTCPECDDSHLEQKVDDKTLFGCNGGHVFRLVKAVACASCGRLVDLLPSGICEPCNRILSEVK